MSIHKERYEDCDGCGERFIGDDAIESYLREVSAPGGLNVLCASCLEHRAEVRDDLAYDADREQGGRTPIRD